MLVETTQKDKKRKRKKSIKKKGMHKKWKGANNRQIWPREKPCGKKCLGFVALIDG